jgi:hypothetical protein
MAYSVSSITKLNEHNYRTWSIAMRNLLSQLGYWRMVTGEAIPPIPPRAKVEIRDTEGTSTRVITRRPSLSHWDLEPESDSDEYMAKYEKYFSEYEKYREKLAMASGGGNCRY